MVLICLAMLLPAQAEAQVTGTRGVFVPPTAPVSALVVPSPPTLQRTVLTGRMIIKVQGAVTKERIAQLKQKMGLQVVSRIGFGPYLLVRPVQGSGFVSLGAPDLPIEYVEPEIRMQLLPIMERKGLPQIVPQPLSKALDARVIPNDPYFAYQWGFMDSLYGVGLPTVRAMTKGLGVIIAVLDTGVRTTAPDLVGTRFLVGRNLLDNSDDTRDDNGHGTHVCGTIAQTTGNGIGCAGLAPEATILPVKVLNSNGQGSNYTIGAGIRYAVDKGARVINMSIGGGKSLTVLDAIDYAYGKGVVICAAAGNSGSRGITWPAAYPRTISVGATTTTGLRASFSQYGPGLCLVAPGSQILQQTFRRSKGTFGYYYLSGTSMATPHVAAAAACILALNPKLTGEQVKSILLMTARDLGPVGWDEKYGAGLLNAPAACQQAASGSAASGSAASTKRATPGARGGNASHRGKRLPNR